MNTLMSAFIDTICNVCRLVECNSGQFTIFEYINIHMTIHEYTHECSFAKTKHLHHCKIATFLREQFEQLPRIMNTLMSARRKQI